MKPGGRKPGIKQGEKSSLNTPSQCISAPYTTQNSLYHPVQVRHAGYRVCRGHGVMVNHNMTRRSATAGHSLIFLHPHIGFFEHFLHGTANLLFLVLAGVGID